MTARFVYFAIAVAIFVVEISIALGMGGPFVRGSVGDLLVIVLLYAALRAVTNLGMLPCALVATALGFCAEGLQYFHVADLLRLPQGGVLYTLLGNTFSGLDLLMYVLGGAFAFILDKWFFSTVLGKHSTRTALE